MKSTTGVSNRARILVRVRPLISEELESHANSNIIVTEVRDNKSIILSKEGVNDREFTFDYVFAADKATQEHFYAITGLPLIKDLFSGYNATIIAYGQVLKLINLDGIRKNL